MKTPHRVSCPMQVGTDACCDAGSITPTRPFAVVYTFSFLKCRVDRWSRATNLSKKSSKHTRGCQMIVFILFKPATSTLKTTIGMLVPRTSILASSKIVRILVLLFKYPLLLVRFPAPLNRCYPKPSRFLSLDLLIHTR